GSGVQPEAEVVQAAAHAVGGHVEQATDGPHVLGADGDHPAVEVLALHLDHAQVAAQQLALGRGDRLQAGEVNGHPAVVGAEATVFSSGGRAVAFARAGGPGRGAAAVPGQQLVDRNIVEI